MIRSVSRRACSTGLLLGLGLLVLHPLDPIQASIYQCSDPFGARVYADSTAQLEQCTMVNVRSPLALAPAVRSRVSSEDGASVQPAADSAAQSSETAPLVPAAPFPPQAMPEPESEGPATLDSDPQISSEVPSPEVQPCAPGLNPLNPFSALLCPTSSAPPPVPAPREIPDSPVTGAEPGAVPSEGVLP